MLSRPDVVVPPPTGARPAGPAPAGPAPAGPAPASTVFEQFCAAGLWPGLGRTLAGRLHTAGITGPADVTARRLELVEGLGPARAARLAAAFDRARPRYQVAELFADLRMPVPLAGPAVDCFGPTAPRMLREDPWLLLTLPRIRPDQADWFARTLLGGDAGPQDVRRGRALVTHLLATAARDGHTAMPAPQVAASLARFGIRDARAAVTAAVEFGSVCRFDVDDAAAGGDTDGAETGADTGGADASGDSDRADEAVLTLTRYAIAEEAVAEGIARLAATVEPLPETEGASGDGIGDSGTGHGDDGTDAALDDRQRAAVAAVVEHGVSVLTGGPGSGKSRAVAAVVSMAAGHGLRVALAAPTGRAAKRLEELAGAPATTLHKLLGAQGRAASRGGSEDGAWSAADALWSEQGRAADAGTRTATDPGRAADTRPADAANSGRAADSSPEATDTTGTRGAAGAAELSVARETSWVFTRDEHWPLDEDVVVVDEASMLDVELAAALVDACADGTRLLLVGDPAQLPSIGPGRVLADIIDSGAVPVTELTALYRQRDGGVIATLATAVRAGGLPPVHSPEREVAVVPVTGSGAAAHRVLQLVTDSIPRALGIAAADIQVVTPVHRGPAGTMALNKALKDRLNPGPGAHRGFDPGDRVVAVANHVEEGFANGEVGTVVGPAGGDGGVAVTFGGPPVTVPGKLLADLRHGWALTVHRAQGSEWPAVVAVFPVEAGRMLSRPLVYTALTRARRHLSVVHGTGRALAVAVRTVGERPRRTRLATLLRENVTPTASGSKVGTGRPPVRR